MTIDLWDMLVCSCESNGFCYCTYSCKKSFANTTIIHKLRDRKPGLVAHHALANPEGQVADKIGADESRSGVTGKLQAICQRRNATEKINGMQLGRRTVQNKVVQGYR